MKHKRFSVWTIAVSCVLVASVLCGTIILGASALSRNIEAEQENTQKDQAELENVPSPVKLTKPSEPLLSTAFLEAGKIERIGNLNISGLISKETAYLFQTADSNVCEVIFPVSGYVYHIDVTFVRESENSEWTLSPVNAVNIFDPAR